MRAGRIGGFCKGKFFCEQVNPTVDDFSFTPTRYERAYPGSGISVEVFSAG
jgi:hypothetical protein